MKSLPFVWEIGCEELPAGWIPGVLRDLKSRFGEQLDEHRLGPAEVETYGTLRRLVIHVPKLSERQPDRREEVIGPPAHAARTEGGEWGPAALGFANRNGVHPKKLTVFHTAKGEYVGFVKETKGQPAQRVLPAVMAATLRQLGFPKFMNWDAEIPDGRGAFPFGRPIRWMVCLLGERVIPFTIQVDESRVRASNKTRGHRFLAAPGSRPGRPVVVGSFLELKRQLKRNYVLLDPSERLKALEDVLARLEVKAGARRVGPLPGLSNAFLANLVEWPGGVVGRYPEEFSSLPEEIRNTVLIHHQKYIPLRQTAAFLAVTNMPGDPKQYIRKGSERVVVARLRDAKFFWDEDLKRPLDSRRQDLEGVLFHGVLGSYARKVDRLRDLATELSSLCGIAEQAVTRAATLAKCDLTTGMVGEFPELQGIVGGLYAREQGESEDVWKAVYGHYRPLGLGDEEDFPLNAAGVLLSLADKLDTLAGLFWAGEVPSGSRDPFALRRAAQGVIRLLLEAGPRLGMELALSPEELLERTFERVEQQQGRRAKDPRAKKLLEEFFAERLRFVFQREFRYDEVNAVFALGPLTFPPEELRRRLTALATLRGSEDFEALSVAFKRVRNILSGGSPGEVDPQAFREEAERHLWAAFRKVEPKTAELIAGGEYVKALRELSRLRPQVDAFFDKVLVMDPDVKLRENRLALLHAMQSAFTRVADLSEIVAGAEAGSS